MTFSIKHSRSRRGVLACLVLGASVTAATPASAAAPQRVAPAAGTYSSLTPHRLLDTRNAGGAVGVGPGGTVHLPVLGNGGVPGSGVSAVVLDVTVSAPTAAGAITAYPDGSSLPATSDLNFGTGQTVSNLVVTPPGPDGEVALRNRSTGTVQVVTDVFGYFHDGAVAEPGALVPTAPTRLLDTRSSSRLGGGRDLQLTVAGHAGVPAGASAVILNLTANRASAPGYLTAYASGSPHPATSDVSFGTGQTVANRVVAAVGSDGKVTVHNASGGATDVIADVTGYFVGGAVRAAGAYQPIVPDRVVDTRSRLGGSTVGSGKVLSPKISGIGQVDESAAAAVVLNATVTQPARAGYLMVDPSRGSALNGTSTLNFKAGQTVSVRAFGAVSQDAINIRNRSAGSIQVVGDVSGYFLAADLPESTGRIVGRVTADPGGAPIATATVYVYPPDYDNVPLTRHVSASGRYALTISPNEGKYLCFGSGTKSYAGECWKDLSGWEPVDELPAPGSQFVGAPDGGTVDVSVALSKK